MIVPTISPSIARGLAARGLLLLLLTPLQACAAVEATALHAQIARDLPVDSIALTRESGHWESAWRDDGRIYGYRVVVGVPSVRFEPTEGERAGTPEFLDATEHFVRGLLASAGSLALDDVPEQLAGASPWCSVVMTDQPWVEVEIFRGPGVQRVVDYQGCPVECDRSADRLLSRLRDLAEQTTAVLRLEDRFDAAPLSISAARRDSCRWMSSSGAAP